MADKDKFLKDYYKNLARLFRGDSPMRQRIAHKVSSPGYSGVPVGTAKAFLKSTTSTYASQLASYGQYSRLSRYSDYCISGDTLIWTIEHGPIAIKKLCEMYPDPKQVFHVYSYDHSKKKVVIDEACNPHFTKKDMTYKVSFDNGGYLIVNKTHKFLLRDGTYKSIEQGLKRGNSLMPLYRAKFLEDKEYVWVNALNKEGTSNNRKWQPEHRFIVEELNNRLLIPDEEVVHHIDFNPNNNLSDNLIIMTKNEHYKYHGEILAKKNNEIKWKDKEWVEKFKKQHSEFMKKNNPAYRRELTFELIDAHCKSLVAAGVNISFGKHVCDYFKTDHLVILRRLKQKGFNSISEYLKSIDSAWKHNGTNNSGKKNPKYNHELSFQKICDFYEKGKTLSEMKSHFDVSQIPIISRLKDNGFKNWTDFVENYENHKVVSVEPYEEIDVYDLSTLINHNFAAGTKEVWKVHSNSSKIMYGFVFIKNSEMETMAEICSRIRYIC